MDAKQIFDEIEHIGIYIVDAQTMETYYENPTAQKYTGKNRIGKPCYSAHGNSSMCASCPLRNERRVSIVNRLDLGMVFVVRSSDIVWNGRPAYVISVAKQADAVYKTEDEKTVSRMSRALQKSVNVYTEINMGTLEYRQINLRNAERFSVASTGSYPPAYEHMCNDEIYPEDAAEVRKVMSPEALQKVSADSEGPDEVVVRYRLKNVSPMRMMESRAIFIRDELPHYVVSLARDVTEETLLREQAETMERILNNVSCGVAIYDADSSGALSIKYVNDGLCKMAKCSKQELTEAAQKDTLVTINDEYRSLVKLAFDRIVTKKSNTSFVTCNATNFKGEHLWATLHLNGIENGDGTTRIYGTFIDVTAEVETRQDFQKKYEFEKRRSRDDASILAYAVFNLRTGRTVEMERRSPLDVMQKQMSLDEFCEDIAKVIVQKDKQSTFEAMFNRDALLAMHKNGTDEQTLEFQRMLPNGKVIWVRSAFHLIADSTGSDVLLFYYCNDINLSKSLELMTSYMATEDYDMLGCINFADDSAIMQYGSNSSKKQEAQSGVCRQEKYSEALEWFVNNAVVPEEREQYRTRAFIGEIKSELAKHENYEFNLHVTGENGKIRTKKIRYTRYNTELEICFFSQTDITETLAQEEEKQNKLKTALLEAKQANAAKTSFLSRMSHDMRTPMNGILGLAELSADETDVGVLKDNIRKIKESGDYLLSLINDTLDFQRIESGKLSIEKQIVPTETLLDGICEIIAPAMKKKNIDFTVQNDNADLNWYIKIDPVRFKQIFINLLSNAVKFTPEGGKITFSFGCLGREGMISHDYIIVSDNGIGMSEDFLKNKIFKPFSQESSAVSAQYAGSGLGLSIVKSLVELMGGHIEVKSELGKGTVFTVYIDFERIEKEKAQRRLTETHKQMDSTAKTLAGKHILIVEDHPLNAEIAQRLLEKTGCKTDWANNGQNGLNAFKNAPLNSYDAILMDVRMPVMDGLEAAKAIRALNRSDAKTVPIIAMTANAYEEDVKQTLAAGMNAHIAKPIEPQRMYGVLAESIKTKQ